MWKHVLTGILSTAIVVAGLGAVIASPVLLSATAARWIVMQTLSSTLHTRQLTARHATGNLLGGFTLEQLDIPGASSLPPGSVLRIQRMRVGPLTSFDIRRLPIMLQRVTVSMPQLARAVTIAQMTGSMAQGWSCSEVRIEDPRRFPRGSVATIQRLDLGVSMRPRTIRLIQNGKLQLPLSDPILFSADGREGALVLSLYAGTVDAQEIWSLLPGHDPASQAPGLITDATLRLETLWAQPTVSGHFRLRQLVRKRFTLVECPGLISLTVRERLTTPQVSGSIVLTGGEARTRHTTIKLERGKLLFAGDPANPDVDVRGLATIEGIAIRLTLKGSLNAPKLDVASTPALPEEQLLLMLATGRRWKGAEAALTEGEVSSDLVNDFIDYMLFDGQGGKLARRIGLSDLSLIYDPKTGGVGAKTEFFNRVGARYEVAPSEDSTPAQPAVRTHTVGAEYKIDDEAAVELTAEKEEGRIAPQPRASSDSSSSPSTPADQSWFDRLWLIFKKRF